MDSVEGMTSVELDALLSSALKKGVKVWASDGQLHYMAPKGALSSRDVEQLKAAKFQLLARLDESAASRSVASQSHKRIGASEAPLTFTQLVHWNLHRLWERNTARLLAMAIRIRGTLDLSALRTSVVDLVNRHDALRTRIVVRDGTPTQEIAAERDSALQEVDLSYLPELSREREMHTRTETFILTPVNASQDFLFAALILKLADQEHVLVLATEHMISDAHSMTIISRDLFVAYRQARSKVRGVSGRVPIQFSDFAFWQRNTHQSRADEHGAHWRELCALARLRFPDESTNDGAVRSGWATVPFRISRELKSELQEWCRVRKTTLVMGVFTAYIALVLRWCSAIGDSVIQYQTDGRFSDKLADTVGYFATVLYPRVGLLEDDTFGDLVTRVTTEFCRAYERADLSYLAAQEPRPEFTRNPIFNWIPQLYGDDIASTGDDDLITCSRVSVEDPGLRSLEFDHEPGVLVWETPQEIVGRIYFPQHRFSISTFERFGQNLTMFIAAMVERPSQPLRDLQLL